MSNPIEGDYDFDLGIDSEIIDYILESTEVQSRISPVACYLLFQSPTGSVVGTENQPIQITSYVSQTPNPRAVIWSSGSLHPELNPYVNNNKGAIFIQRDGIELTRVVDVEDIQTDSEFAVVKRNDLTSKQVEVVFSQNFTPGSSSITFRFNTSQPGIEDVRLKRGEDNTQSLYGWQQYLSNHSDKYRKVNQILVRQPLVRRDLSVNEEGKVLFEENQCWMVGSPYVKDFDILVVPANPNLHRKEERFEILDKQDSVIQQTLISQRFKIKLLEPSDSRYQLPIVT